MFNEHENCENINIVKFVALQYTCLGLIINSDNHGFSK